jgi:hypothetical protein
MIAAPESKTQSVNLSSRLARTGHSLSRGFY